MKKFLFISLIFSSCVITSISHLVNGRVEVISIKDVPLGDSVLIVGQISTLSSPYRIPESEIWIENSKIKTYPDSIGFYQFKLMPGKYKIFCQEQGNVCSQLILSKDLTAQKNKKVEINFHLGYLIQ